MLDEALVTAGSPAGAPVVEVAEVFLAGVDFPSEEEQMRSARGARLGSTYRRRQRHLRGPARGHGARLGRRGRVRGRDQLRRRRARRPRARFPSLGAITGDWGGGYDVGLAALSAAARSEDGRAPQTSLERTVPAHFGFETPLELAEAIHAGTHPASPADRARAARPRVVLDATGSPPGSSTAWQRRS